MNKTKVVCIVQNIDDYEKGLSHTLPDLSESEFFMKCFYKGEIDVQGNFTLNTIFGQPDNEYLIINSNGPILAKSVIEEDLFDIVLVSDSVDIKNYSSCLFSPDTLFMYHTTPANAEHELIKMQNSKVIKQCKKGQHEPRDVGYFRLGKLIEAWTHDHFNKEDYDIALKYIIEWFGNDKLESVLEFLHECLIKKPDLSLLEGIDIKTPCISVIDGGDKVIKNIDQLWNDLKNRPLDDIQTFNNFRDGVLKMAGVE